MSKVKLYLWTLPRWFALPFFFSSCIMGVFLAGGNLSELRAWLGVIMVAGLMVFGHHVNSVLDFVVGLDEGTVDERSAEKSYSGGQSVIATGKASILSISVAASIWALISLGIAYWFTSHGSWPMIIVWALGILMPFLYTPAKFTRYWHELTLGVAVGPIALLVGSFAVNSHPSIWHGILVSVPFAVVLAIAGLSLDEFPDASQNLKKGVKSLSFRIWQYSDLTYQWTTRNVPQPEAVKSLSLLQWYLGIWLIMLFGYQVLLIDLSILKSLTAVALVTFPAILVCLVFLKVNFNKAAFWIVIFGASYLVMLTVFQAVG